MNLLLDTHIFIWWDDDVKKLSPSVMSALTDPKNIIYLSTVSIWEMQIKTQLGKLKFSLPLKEKVSEQMSKNNLNLLNIYDHHIYELEKLPHHHRDPFDRLLIAQARIEKMTLITHDANIQKYSVKTLW